MRTSPRGAFTLVEVLVVITIISILASLMLSGVMSVRETGRRATCTSNLSQLGVALQGYEAAQGTLPPGSIGPKGPVLNTPQDTHLSWITQLLPQIEENTTFRAIDFSVGPDDPRNTAVRAVRIRLLACPSDGNRRPPDDRGTSNYAGCHHDAEAPIDQDNHGVMILNRRIALKDVTDGLSHTIFVGEKQIDSDDLGWLSGTRATLRNTGTPLGTQAAAAYQPLTTPLPGVGGFSASHRTGANFLFGDGAVRFVSDGIEGGVYQQLGHRADGKLLVGGPTRSD